MKELLITTSAFETIKKESLKYKKTETGGLLIGSMKTPFVIKATTQGKNAKATAISYTSDVEYDRVVLEKTIKEYEGKVKYIGQWHKHPGNFNTPSFADLREVKDMIKEFNETKEQRPFFMLISNVIEGKVTIHAYNFQNNNFEPIPISITDNEKEIENALKQEPLTVLPSPTTNFWNPDFQFYLTEKGNKRLKQEITLLKRKGYKTKVLINKQRLYLEIEKGIFKIKCLPPVEYPLNPPRLFNNNKEITCETLRRWNSDFTLKDVVEEVTKTLKPKQDKVNEEGKYQNKKAVRILKNICDSIKHTLTKPIFLNIEDMYKRTPFPKHLLRKLKKSRVLIFGVGTGGSRLAIGLARAGVYNFTLADPDKYKIHNNSRHELDLTDLGKYKVKALKEKLLRINPYLKVKTFPINVFESDIDLDKLFKDVDLVIAATDCKSIQLRINYETWKRRIPTLFGGCFEEALGGDIFYTLPGKTVCYECVKGKGIPEPDPKRKFEYSEAESIEDYKGEPGLHSAINLVTAIAEQFAIALLLREEKCQIAKLIQPERNWILVGGLLARGYYVFEKPFQMIKPLLSKPRKDCGCCQRKRDLK